MFQSIPRSRRTRPRDDSQGSGTEDEEISDVDAENNGDSEDEIAEHIEEEKDLANEVDDEEDWMKFQEEAKKDNSLETKSKETYPVHCPYHPAVSLIKNPTLGKYYDLLTMKRQWTYGPTLLPWFDHFRTSLACFTF